MERVIILVFRDNAVKVLIVILPIVNPNCVVCQISERQSYASHLKRVNAVS